jgi:5-formyltetrahydrofolate cyclo-ligase
MSKQDVRKQILEWRSGLPETVRRQYGEAAARRVIALEAFCRARTIGLYSPVRGEVPTAAIFAAAVSCGKRVAYPRVCGEDMEFVTVTSLEDLQRGSFGVAEPIGKNTVAVSELDLLIMPGVAFSLSGWRLGYGKGYYDRLLSREKPAGLRAGLCYEGQLVPALFGEAHDVPVQLIVTEARVVFVQNG